MCVGPTECLSQRYVATVYSARRFTDVVVTGVFRGTTGSWEVLAEAGGSRVRLVAEMRAVGLGRLLLPLIDRGARKDLETEFVNLKQVLETAAQG